MLKFMDPAGKTVLVTGASRRIGRSIALALATAGADIILHYHRSESEAEATAQEIEKLGGRAEVSSQDLSDPEASASWFAELEKRPGGIDILINSASEFPQDRHASMQSGSLNRSMALHYLSPLFMMRHLHSLEKQSTVVNILDTRAVGRDPAHASYHMGKKALLAATRELAVEFAPLMRINAVAPGLILPPEGQDEDWIERLKKTNPLESRGNGSDVAEAVLYLCRADFVTGQVIFVDGGRHLKGMNYEL